MIGGSSSGGGGTRSNWISRAEAHMIVCVNGFSSKLVMVSGFFHLIHAPDQFSIPIEQWNGFYQNKYTAYFISIFKLIGIFIEFNSSIKVKNKDPEKKKRVACEIDTQCRARYSSFYFVLFTENYLFNKHNEFNIIHIVYARTPRPNLIDLAMLALCNRELLPQAFSFVYLNLTLLLSHSIRFQKELIARQWTIFYTPICKIVDECDFWKRKETPHPSLFV